MGVTHLCSLHFWCFYSIEFPVVVWYIGTTVDTGLGGFLMTDSTNVLFLQMACMKGYHERVWCPMRTISRKFQEFGILDMIAEHFSTLASFSVDTILDGIEYRISNGIKYTSEDMLSDLVNSSECDLFYTVHTIELILDKLQDRFPKEARNVLLAEFTSSKVFEQLMDSKTRMWTEGADALVALYLEEKG